MPPRQPATSPDMKLEHRRLGAQAADRFGAHTDCYCAAIDVYEGADGTRRRVLVETGWVDGDGAEREAYVCGLHDADAVRAAGGSLAELRTGAQGQWAWNAGFAQTGEARVDREAWLEAVLAFSRGARARVEAMAARSAATPPAAAAERKGWDAVREAGAQWRELFDGLTAGTLGRVGPDRALTRGLRLFDVEPGARPAPGEALEIARGACEYACAPADGRRPLLARAEGLDAGRQGREADPFINFRVFADGIEAGLAWRRTGRAVSDRRDDDFSRGLTAFCAAEHRGIDLDAFCRSARDYERAGDAQRTLFDAWAHGVIEAGEVLVQGADPDLFVQGVREGLETCVRADCASRLAPPRAVAAPVRTRMAVGFGTGLPGAAPADAAQAQVHPRVDPQQFVADLRHRALDARLMRL